MTLTPEIAKSLLELDTLNKVFQSEKSRLVGSVREQFEEERRIICSRPDGTGDQNEALRAIDEFLAEWQDDSADG